MEGVVALEECGQLPGLTVSLPMLDLASSASWLLKALFHQSLV